jgi:hypothetical protein
MAVRVVPFATALSLAIIGLISLFDLGKTMCLEVPRSILVFRGITALIGFWLAVAVFLPYDALYISLFVWGLVALVVIVSFTWSMHTIIQNSRNSLSLWLVGVVATVLMCAVGVVYGLDHSPPVSQPLVSVAPLP